MMAKSRQQLPNSEKSQLYQDDLYSDFDVAGHELNADLSGSPALAEAVRTSQLARRVPSVSTVARQASASARRSTDLLTAGTQRSLGAIDSDVGQSGPPLTAALCAGAGFSSVGGHVSIAVMRTFLVCSDVPT